MASVPLPSQRPDGVSEEAWKAIQSVRADPLSQLLETAAAMQAAQSEELGREVARAIDKVRDFAGVGIVFRSASGVRQMRLPTRPGDMTLVVQWGPPPVNPPAAEGGLRQELELAAAGCGGAIIGWVGFVMGASLSGPIGWLALSLVVFDGLAAGAASISCLQSGVRVINAARGNTAANERLDNSPFFRAQSRAMDAIGLMGVPRALTTSPATIGRLGGEAVAAARAGTAVARGTQVIRELAINREMRLELLGAVNIALGLYSSARDGNIGDHVELANTPVRPPASVLAFTIALTN